MSRPRAPHTQSLPLLDRLIDHEPQTSREPVAGRAELARTLLEAIRRDLEVLFNTRRRLVVPPEGAGDQLDRSLAGYGLPASRGTELGSPRRREELRQAVESAIRLFEPRLADVTVRLEQDPGPSEALALVIEATFVVDPDLGPVSLRSALDPISGRLSVEGAAS
jgi:type VI secretion system protein ImpF